MVRVPWRKLPWRGIGEGAGLALALAFVLSMQFIPHLDTANNPPAVNETGLVRLGTAVWDYAEGDREGYPYAVHVDEHVHWVWITKVQRWDKVQTGSPYTTEPPDQNVFDSLRGTVHERGFHLFFAQIQELTGVSWFHIFKFLPALWMGFTAFCVYALLRPNPAAIPAAAMVGLIPTTLRFMGPAFLVPIGFVLAWLPVTAILSGPGRKRAPAAILLFLVVGWAFFVHLIGGFAAVAIIGLGALFGAREDRKSSLILMLIALLPVLWLYRTFTGDVQGEVAREESLPIDLTIFDSFGFLPLMLWALGVLIMVWRPPKHHRTEVASFAGLSVFALTLIIGGLALDLGRYATYARWHPPFFLAAAVPAGYALATIGREVAGATRRGIKQASKRLPPARRALPIAPAVGILLAVLLTGAAVTGSVHEHLRENYYHVMNDESYAAYTAAEGLGPEYEVFLTHPWRAPFLTAMTGKHPHTVLLPGTPPVRGEDYAAYSNADDTLEMYIMNDITLVSGPREPHPTDAWNQVGPFLWALDPGVVQELHQIRADEGRTIVYQR